MSIHDEYHNWKEKQISLLRQHKHQEKIHKNLSPDQQLQLNIKLFETYSALLLNNDSSKYNELLDLIEQGAKNDLFALEPYCLTDKFTLSFDSDLQDRLYGIWKETLCSPGIFVYDELSYFTVIVTNWINGRFYEQGLPDHTIFNSLKLILTAGKHLAESQNRGGRVGMPSLYYMFKFLAKGNPAAHNDSNPDMVDSDNHQRQEQLFEYVYNLVEIIVLTGTNLESFWYSLLQNQILNPIELPKSIKYYQGKTIRLCILYLKEINTYILDPIYIDDFISYNLKPFLHSGRSDLILDAIDTIEYRFGWQEIDNIMLNHESACLKIFNGFFSSKQARKTLSVLLNTSSIFRQKIFKFPYFIFDLVRKKERKLISQLLNYNATEMKNMRDKHGNSLLLFACKVRGKNLKIVQLFTSHGFDVYLKNFEGLNAIDIASQAKNKEVVTYIKSRLGVQ